MRFLPNIAALDRKLLRDVWGMKGQATAIAIVVAVGVAMFVAYLSNFDSLQRTLDTFYDRQRFADVFASLKRAPQRLEDRIAALPGVSVAETRVVAEVTLDVPGMREPATGRLVSIPTDGRPRLNDVFLSEGRWIEAGREEVIVSEPFARAHGLGPGGRIAALINGRRRELRIAGLGFSPEYVYTIRRGEIIPDETRFGILWMERRALGSAFDMEGGFNDVALRLVGDTNVNEVIAELDKLLVPYGGLGAIPRELQISHWTISNELRQLRTFGFLVPVIFLGVAAFLLNVALTRALAIQRPQIAALKALGYNNIAIGWHYLKWALLIAAVGTVGGIALGAWLGAGMLDLYNQIFRFPVLLYRLSTTVAVGAGLSALLGAACLGAIFAVRRAVAVPPAEAMRPEPPAHYRRSLFERRVFRRLSHVGRMVLRNLERRPVRALASIFGISFAVAIFFFGMVFLNVMTLLADLYFGVSQRQHVTVTFAEPASARAFHELRSLPGVIDAEPIRVVAARFRHGSRVRYLPLTGAPAAARLSRVVALDGKVVTLPPDGIVVSQMLAEILDVKPGDAVQVDILEGSRIVREVRVAALVDDAIGLMAHMEIGAMHRLLREGDSLSGAHLLVDSAQLDELYLRLKAVPRVSAVAIKSAALESFRKIMAQNFEIITFFNVVFALVIAFGVVYNAARVSLSERSRELASLRVLGFTIGEIASILLGELAVLTLIALPVGVALGSVLAQLMVLMFQNELYRLRVVLTPQDAAWSALTVIFAATISALAVRRRLDHLDLVQVLKTPE